MYPNKYLFDLITKSAQNSINSAKHNGSIDQLRFMLCIGDVGKRKYFNESCEKGYLKAAKWLYGLGSVNIHANNEYVFRVSCDNGHLKVAKWLFGLGEVDIHACDDWAFRWCCYNGHLKAAKWLFGLGVDIYAINGEAFRWSCTYGHFKVAK